ncbi:MAG: porin family protein, partial [Chlorobiaceae bacterium]|nr:porin family protein [Chlorobiaceae bacterium]
MKKSLSLLAVLAVLGFAGTPAQAADHYVSGMAGVSWMQDSAIGLFNVEEIFDTEVNLGYGSGLTLAGAIGCDYGS